MHTIPLAKRDRKVIWHPFTQMLHQQDPIVITGGKGSYLYTDDGRCYLDGISSWWVNLHGHAHPHIVQAIAKQAEQLEHVIFADFTHQGAIELAERLLKILPGEMSKIFYSDNGSTAVEVAIKIAIQYWYNQDKETKKKKIISFQGGYHGDTFGAMSAAGRNVFNRPFWNHFFEIESIDPPLDGHVERSLHQLKKIVSKGESACFIFEPLVLGSGGMILYNAKALDALLQLCREHQVLTIADEVMTGFGRTGPLFASDILEEKPDMICLSKGLTGGFLPLGATACTLPIFEAFLSTRLSDAFLHGHSYTANPLACSAALGSLDLLEKQECTLQRKQIAENHFQFCKKWKFHPKLKRCESIGTILVLEYRSVGDIESSYLHPIRDRLYKFFLDHEILLRPLGNVLYILPPYCIKTDELQLVYDHIIYTLENW